jgi:hypothetical protein
MSHSLTESNQASRSDSPQSPTSPRRDSDEINLLEYIYALVKHKRLIIILTILGAALGYVAALVKGPTWVAEAVIAPKEAESQKMPNLSGLGALGGFVASELNIGTNASLEKIDLTLDSREFGAKLIDKYSLVPALYRYQWPKTFKRYWEVSSNGWKSNFVQPNLLSLGGELREIFLTKVTNKNNTMTIKIKSKDSVFTQNLSEVYLKFLNEYLKIATIKNAQENVAYLDTQLTTIIDPLLREKIQGFVASEIEKEMVVSKTAFQVVDPFFMSKKFMEIKLYPTVFGLFLFFLCSIIVLLIHGIKKTPKTEEDQKLIAALKKECLRISR